MTKVISYIRVSTSFQDLENQKLEISRYAAKLGLEVTEWFEVEMSSRKTTGDRRINELLDSLHKGDVLVVSELSRLARSMREIHNFTHTLEQKGICLHVVKQGIVVDGNKDIATKILINTFGVCAELERELISQRVKMGMALAKQRGRQIGQSQPRSLQQSPEGRSRQPGRKIQKPTHRIHGFREDHPANSRRTEYGSGTDSKRGPLVTYSGTPGYGQGSASISLAGIP